VVDEETPADASSGMDLDPSGEATQVREQATEKAELMPPQEMGQAMKPQGMKSWITKEDLPGVSRRWVFGKNGLDIFF
jgi:hypothetical protein